MKRERKFTPGWMTAAGAALGPLVALLSTDSPVIMAGSGLLGTAAGVPLDYTIHALHNLPLKDVIRNFRGVFSKLDADLRDNTLRSWEINAASYNKICAQLERADLLSFGDTRIRNARARESLKSYLAHSNCRRGEPRQESLSMLHAFGPITFSTASIHAGIKAAILIIVEDFGLPLKVIEGYANGVEQVEALNNGAYVDFAVIADANVFMAANKATCERYRLILPCFWQKQHAISRKGTVSSDGSLLWYSWGTTGEEQLRLKTRSVTDFGEYGGFPVDEMITRIHRLDYGETLLGWDPIVFMNCTQENELVSSIVDDYQLSNSLYCHRSLNSPTGTVIQNAFQDCLVAAWNKARIERAEMLVRLMAVSDYRKQFSRAASSRH